MNKLVVDIYVGQYGVDLHLSFDSRWGIGHIWYTYDHIHTYTYLDGI